MSSCSYEAELSINDSLSVCACTSTSFEAVQSMTPTVPSLHSHHSDIISPPDRLVKAESNEGPGAEEPAEDATSSGETRGGLSLESSERVPEREVSISGRSSSSSSEFSLPWCMAVCPAAESMLPAGVLGATPPPPPPPPPLFPARPSTGITPFGSFFFPSASFFTEELSRASVQVFNAGAELDGI